MLLDSAWRDVLDLMVTQYGVFHRRQATERGLSAFRIRSALRNGELREVANHVFTMTSTPASWEQTLLANTLVGGAASHRAAAVLHGLDGFQSAPIELVRDRLVNPRFEGVIEHRWRRLHERYIIDVNGIPTTNVAVTLAQLGAVASRNRVEQALDSAIRQGYNISWIEATLEELWRTGPSGVGTLRRILVDPRRTGADADSWFERVVSTLLDTPGLPRPTLQHNVTAAGRIRRLDLAFPEVMLAIECHSKAFHLSVDAIEQDNQRHLDLSAAGWEVIYVTWAMAQQPEDLVNSVKTIYRRRLAHVA